jgi:hypothetical protein
MYRFKYNTEQEVLIMNLILKLKEQSRIFLSQSGYPENIKVYFNMSKKDIEILQSIK